MTGGCARGVDGRSDIFTATVPHTYQSILPTLSLIGQFFKVSNALAARDWRNPSRAAGHERASKLHLLIRVNYRSQRQNDEDG